MVVTPAARACLTAGSHRPFYLAVRVIRIPIVAVAGVVVVVVGLLEVVVDGPDDLAVDDLSVAGDPAEVDGEPLVDARVVPEDLHRDRLGRLARGEHQGAGGGHVVHARRGRAVG